MRSRYSSAILVLIAASCSQRNAAQGGPRAIDIVDAIQIDLAPNQVAEACQHEGTQLHDPCFLKDGEREEQRSSGADKLRLALVITQHECQTLRDQITRRIESNPSFARAIVDHIEAFLVPDADANKLHPVRSDVRRSVQKALHTCLADSHDSEDWVVKERFPSLSTLVDEDLITAASDLGRAQSLARDLDAFLQAR